MMDTALAPDTRGQPLAAKPTPLLVRGDTLGGELFGNRGGVPAIETHLEDTPHEVCFFGVDLILPLFMAFDVAIPQWDRAALGMASFGTSERPTLEPFEDFGPLIFCNGATHLEEEPAFRPFFEGMGHNKQPYTRLFEFLTQE